MDPDKVDASSATTPDADADADVDADADAAPNEPSQKGEPCVCVGDGVPDPCTVTVDVIVFKLAHGLTMPRAGAEDATAPRTFSSNARFRLLARCFKLRGECAPPPAPSSARISIARATPRPRRPSIDMSERVRTTPPALTVLVVTPVLWNGSTLGAVRSAGESTDRRPMFAPGGMSQGRKLVGEAGVACSDKVRLENVEDEAVGRMRWWR
jgi:hypothetical protein